MPTGVLAQDRPQPGAETQDRPESEQQEQQRITTLEHALRTMKEAQEKLLKRLEELEQRNQEQEIQLIQMQATAEAASGGEVVKQADEEAKLEEKVFRGGQRALQALNPELSVVGDAFGRAILNEEGYTSESDRSGFVFRMIGIHFQSDLDPFSFTKITVGITPDGVSLGEAYLTWTSLLPGVSLTAGKFRQEFGVVNRWHLPGLDQVDWPLAMREILGPGGLNQVGLSIDWLMPRLWAHTNHLVLQVTNGQNDRLFAGKHFSVPAVLLRLKSYYDLTESTYFELGLTGMLGWNNPRGKADESGELEDEAWRSTGLWGADWTLVWEPLKRAKYRNLVLRGELYGARKDLGDDRIQQAVGLYQQVQGKVSRRLELGTRFDWTMPFSVDNTDQFLFAVQPYVTWWQSPWVRVRLHYAYTFSTLEPAKKKHDHRLILQATFAAGPHKHERY
jgi:hypothetical protein